MRPAVRRAVGLVLIGVVVAVTCTFLGRWQWHRHVVKDRLIAVVQANWAAAPVPLSTLAPPGAGLTPASEWRSVRAEGHYVPSATVLLRNRPVASHSAYHVLVPFVTQDGSVLVVDRGWVPIGSNGSTAPTPAAPPAGTTTLVGRVRMPEAASTRGAPAGQVQSIDVPQVLAAAGAAAPAGTAYPFYVAVSTEDPAPAQALGTLDPPDTDPGPHLSYAFQWWVFALGGFAACVWSARRELLEERQERAAAPARRAGDADGIAATSAPVAHDAGRDETAGPTTAPAEGSGAADEGRAAAGPSHKRPRRRPGRDELAEDALVDAQLGGGSPGRAPGRPEDAEPR
ncbi:SURF1 family protein [Cellulomonas sp. NTE-D12]|uniref:SURF1 family cytochrome oxidase biogenesis protein n=1 Tax=Cellulomonas sp. NTE-D12 TaxID=2962632 RepID=UPI003081ADEA|nr:SURF1-like protein [Cellulomonas sp. NTE-D12]